MQCSPFPKDYGIFENPKYWTLWHILHKLLLFICIEVISFLLSYYNKDLFNHCIMANIGGRKVENKALENVQTCVG
jgi:hypothetical protein